LVYTIDVDCYNADFRICCFLNSAYPTGVAVVAGVVVVAVGVVVVAVVVAVVAEDALRLSARNVL
jgi:hypothetical protein